MNLLAKSIFLFSAFLATSSFARTSTQMREKCGQDLSRLGSSGNFDETSPARDVDVTVIDYGPGNKFDWVRDRKRTYDLNYRFVAKYPKFFHSLRIDRLSTSEILAPSDALTTNGAVEKYNKDKPLSQQIPLRWFDEFTAKGIETLEFLSAWVSGLIPINQVDPYSHNHDVGSHLAFYVMLPHEVVLRSRHNYSLMLDLLKAPAFRRNREFKENLLIYLNMNLEAEPARAFGLFGGKRSQREKHWNALIMNPDYIRKEFSRFVVTKTQFKIFKLMLDQFQPQLTTGDLLIAETALSEKLK